MDNVVIAKPRGVDPVTSEIDYDADDLELIMAVDEYKRSKGRPFPTLREYLMIIRQLGYSKTTVDEDETFLHKTEMFETTIQ